MGQRTAPNDPFNDHRIVVMLALLFSQYNYRLANQRESIWRRRAEHDHKYNSNAIVKLQKDGPRLPLYSRTLNAFQINSYCYGIIHWNRGIKEHHSGRRNLILLLVRLDVSGMPHSLHLCVTLCIRNCYDRSSGEIRSCAAEASRHFRLQLHN